VEKEEGLRRRRTRRKEEAWAEAETAGGRAWRVADDGRRRTSVLDDGQDRGEAGNVGDNRKSRTSAEEGGRETRGGLEMAYSTRATRARHTAR